MSITLQFEIELLSDYHVGSGHGRGATVDSTLFRDSDETPALRGTTINGLLRDGLWRLVKDSVLSQQQRCAASGLPETVRFCGQGDPLAPPCPICRLFGSPAY